MDTARQPRVLIVAEDASPHFGGEAMHPLRYFTLMRRKGVDVRMVTHGRNRDPLATMLGDDISRVQFVEDSPLYRTCTRWSDAIPARVSNFTIGLAARIATQMRAKQLARELIAANKVDIVHQPTPISPKEISLMYGLGVPVVMGPLDGNIEYPPAFRSRESRAALAFTRTARPISHALHWVVPGKRAADVLLVSNERTRRALPWGINGRVIELVENGVELDIWQPKTEYRGSGEPTRFIYLGRLVDWKAVDLLIQAFARVATQMDARLTIVGDGDKRAALEQLAQSLGLGARIEFVGYKSQPEAAQILRDSDVFVLPSLCECGGAVVLEAMASGLPVIATNWGGPADYVDAYCGILIDPTSKDGFISGLASAMTRLAGSPDLRRQMGQAGRRRAESDFVWDHKVDRLLEVFDGLVAGERMHRRHPRRFRRAS